MRVQINTNTANTSFGMAKLTRKGNEIVRQLVSQDIPVYASLKPYTTKNMLKKIIKAGCNVDRLNEFMKNGTTCFQDKNAQFVNKQLMPITGRMSIIKFLAKDHNDAVRTLDIAPVADNIPPLTAKGRALVDAILDVFDKNLSNPSISRKKGIKVLDLIKPYINSKDHINRMAILSDKLYSIK